MSIESLDTNSIIGRKTETERKETIPALIEIIENHFLELKKLVDTNTGLFPAVNPDINTPESRENEMQKAWIRDTAFIILDMTEVAKQLEELQPQNQTTNEIRGFVKDNLEKLLGFLNQPRWINSFNQKIIDEGAYTRLSEPAPQMHMELDGSFLEWDHNQPEAWADLLLAACRAQANGDLENYSEKAAQTIRAITEYLVRIKPWKFQGAAMWEGLNVHSPASRSNALAIAKSLESASSFFQNDEHFKTQIDETVTTTMNFIRENINKDYTTPEGHPDGADLAMLVTMILPGSPATQLPFAKYVEDNSRALGIGDLPGAKRFKGDSYYEGELGEARWFMANPVLAIGYFDEAEEQLKNGNLALALSYQKLGLDKLIQAEEISEQYGHENDLYPELFIQRNPDSITDVDTLIYKDGNTNVALQPLKRSLLWNSGLMMIAKTKAKKLEIAFHRYQDHTHSMAA